MFTRSFIEFLRLADAHYHGGARIRVVLDNHSAHISQGDTRMAAPQQNGATRFRMAPFAPPVDS